MARIPANFEDRSVCILGLGYVGLTLAAVMADTGFDVLGVEIRDDVVAKLGTGEPHFFEPGLPDLLQRIVGNGKIRFRTHIPGDWGGKVYIITVGTPLGVDGKPRLDMVMNISREVRDHLREGDLIIMRSTVMIGTTRSKVMPILEEAGVHFDLAFCPERTIEGKALIELRQLPQIVGATSLGASVRASQIFQFLTPTVVRVSDVETAEMIKLIDNAQRDVSFAYANEVARLCDAVGISAHEVIQAGKLGYPRTSLPMPGPVGGPCLEKDPYILEEGLRPFGAVPEISMTARKINERQPEEVVSYLAGTMASLKGFPEKPVISLLGIAFKGQPATDDLRGTMARPVLAALTRSFPGACFRGYDAVVSREVIRDFGLEPHDNLESVLKGAHLALILNNHPVFTAMPIANLSYEMARPGLIYDFWNNFHAADLNLAPWAGYLALGSHGKGILPGEFGDA